MRPRPRRRHPPDGGSQFLEFAVYLPFLLFTMVLAIEVFLAVVAMERAENAAAVGARMAGTNGVEAARAAAEDSLPDWIEPDPVTVAINDQGGYYGEVSFALPLMFPASGLDLDLTRRVDMPAT